MSGDAGERVEATYEIDIGNGLPPLEINATCFSDAARQVFDRLSTNVCSIRGKGMTAWLPYDRDTWRLQPDEDCFEE